MPNQTFLTYGQLHDKLRELGFQEYTVELEGKRGRVFENKTISGSLIVLPEKNPKALVEDFHLQGVLMKLKSFGLLPDTNPLYSGELACGER